MKMETFGFAKLNFDEAVPIAVKINNSHPAKVSSMGNSCLSWTPNEINSSAAILKEERRVAFIARKKTQLHELEDELNSTKVESNGKCNC